MLNYEQLRSIDLSLKSSKRNRETKMLDCGRFSVGFTSKGEAFIVDTDIADKIKYYSWSVDPGGYLQARIHDERVRLHDYVMAFEVVEKPKNYYVDHINHDKLDNRRTNLRMVSATISAVNRKLRNNSTGVRGVSKVKDRDYYEAYIGYKGKHIHLGVYKTIEEAKNARLKAEKMLGLDMTPRTVEEICRLEIEGNSGEGDCGRTVYEKVSPDLPG